VTPKPLVVISAVIRAVFCCQPGSNWLMKHCYIGWECCHEQPRDTFFNFIMWLVVLEHVCWHITNHAMKMPQALVDRKETLLLLVIYLTHWILVELWSLDSDVIVRRIFDIAKLRLAYMSV